MFAAWLTGKNTINSSNTACPSDTLGHTFTSQDPFFKKHAEAFSEPIAAILTLIKKSERFPSSCKIAQILEQSLCSNPGLQEAHKILPHFFTGLRSRSEPLPNYNFLELLPYSSRETRSEP